MANMCDFTMCVKGERKDIEKFYEALILKGNIHMGRGSEAMIGINENGNLAYIGGWCKWSLASALYDNAISMRKELNMWYFGENVNSDELEFVTIVEASEKWDLIVEAYST